MLADVVKRNKPDSNETAHNPIHLTRNHEDATENEIAGTKNRSVRGAKELIALIDKWENYDDLLIVVRLIIRHPANKSFDGNSGHASINITITEKLTGQSKGMQIGMDIMGLVGAEEQVTSTNFKTEKYIIEIFEKKLEGAEALTFLEKELIQEFETPRPYSEFIYDANDCAYENCATWAAEIGRIAGFEIAPNRFFPLPSNMVDKIKVGSQLGVTRTTLNVDNPDYDGLPAELITVGGITTFDLYWDDREEGDELKMIQEFHMDEDAPEDRRGLLQEAKVILDEHYAGHVPESIKNALLEGADVVWEDI